MNASGMTAWSPAAFGLPTCPWGISGSARSAMPELFINDPLAYLKLRAPASRIALRSPPALPTSLFGPLVISARNRYVWLVRQPSPIGIERPFLARGETGVTRKAGLVARIQGSIAGKFAVRSQCTLM